MKRLLYFSLVLATIVACKPKNDEPTAPQTDPVSHGEPANKPNWQEIINPEFPSSMTITCLPPEGETVSADDEVAAFWGDTCRAVADQVKGIFYMVVVGPQTTLPMQVKYYSATYKTIRTTTITYTPEANIGSTDEPYRLDFSGQTSAPQRIQLQGTLPNSAQTNSPIRRINIGEIDQQEDLALYWRANDRILLQKKDGTNATTLEIEKGADSKKADFVGWASYTDLKDYYITCPTSAHFNSSNDIVYTLPAEQTYVQGNYENNLMPMYAPVHLNQTTDEYEFTMSPIATLIQLNLTSTTGKTVTQIDIEVPEQSTNQVYIAGEMVTSGVVTSPLSTQGGTGRKVTLNCGTGVALGSAATTFNIVLPAVVLPENTSFTFHYTEGDPTVRQIHQLSLGHGQFYPIQLSI